MYYAKYNPATEKTIMFRQLVATLALCFSTVAIAQNFVVDLTHPIPTFKPLEGDPMTPDTEQPWLDSKPIPTFGQQTVLTISEFPTNWGHFDLGLLVLAEHHGTHMDTPAHYINNAETMEEDGIPPDQRKLAHQLGAEDLIGPVVMIDISGRVQSELDKNGGRPDPDGGVTDFSENSANVVTADDIDAVADQLGDGVWLVVNTGWSKFYFDGTDFAKDPYINGWNHPGLSRAAMDRLIELEKANGYRIRGIVADNIGIESGVSAKGEDDQWTNSWYVHRRGLQRGWLFVENATNLGQLAMAQGSCTLIVGAPKHVRGTGGPSRVLAMCQRSSN
jgi:kynurenine formamidase